MSRRLWFLPEEPDVLGLLRHQVALTVQGIDAFATWATTGGDAPAAATVRALEHDADAAKLELRSSLRTAFVTPLDPEDLFALSRGIDSILNHAKNTIGESEAMGCPPDDAMATMARCWPSPSATSTTPWYGCRDAPPTPPISFWWCSLCRDAPTTTTS